jgi:hypothetical protein
LERVERPEEKEERVERREARAKSDSREESTAERKRDVHAPQSDAASRICGGGKSRELPAHIYNE